MEREKELLRIFLKVSQMENTILRRMNLSSFLMVSLSVGGRVTRICATKSRKLWGWYAAAAAAICGVASSWFGQPMPSGQPPLGTALRCLSCPISPTPAILSLTTLIPANRGNNPIQLKP